MKDLFDKISFECSRMTTRTYSTSFSLGIRFVSSEIRQHIYSIYGFVRFADEIVDSFHNFPKEKLLGKFRAETYEALEDGISLNPILNAFQHTVKTYGIRESEIDTFLKSMEMDLNKRSYDSEGYEEYILGSAEVVGLMCLHVFCNGDNVLFEKARPYAMRLGSAFQKINFLRDLKQDYVSLGRTYFPGIDMDNFDDACKENIQREINTDFQEAYKGIKLLPKNSRFGVYVAYVYYYRLLKKIEKVPSSQIMKTRIRIPNKNKYAMFVGSYVKHSLNLL